MGNDINLNFSTEWSDYFDHNWSGFFFIVLIYLSGRLDIQPSFEKNCFKKISYYYSYDLIYQNSELAFVSSAVLCLATFFMCIYVCFTFGFTHLSL